MKRQPDGSFEPIDTDTAIAEIAGRLKEIIDRNGPRSVAGFLGKPGVEQVATAPVMMSLLRAIGSPMFFSMATLDQPNTKIAEALHGAWDGGRMRPETLDVMLIVGGNPVISKQYFGQNPGMRLKELVRRGTKLIVIDPRRSETARRADVHLQPIPGQDAAIAAGLVHLAGVHLASAEQSGGNGAIIRDRLGAGYRLLKMARWEEGLAVAPGSGITTIQGAVELRSSKQQWVGREVGSGARQCLDELLDGRPAPKKIARDHAGVAEAIRCGWADVGVCLKLSAEEAGLEFLSVRHETYDICYRAEFEPDPRFQALLTASRSPTFRKLLGELPGYEVAHTGELESI